AAQRDAFAIFLQTLLVDGLDAEEHVFDAELLPELEHVLVAQQNVAAGLQVVFLLDSLAGDRLADGETMAILDERHVVDDEDPRILDEPEVLDHMLGAHEAVAAAIEGPGAAERAIPRAATREFDRSSRIEHADEILAAVAQQVARRHQGVEAFDEMRCRAVAV